MELGALVCIPKTPRCEGCPVVAWCMARAAGEERQLPQRARRTVVPSVTAVFGLLERPGEVFMVHRNPDELLGGLWALPGGEIREDESPGDGLRRLLREDHGLVVEAGLEVGRHVHGFSHKRWDAIGLRCNGKAAVTTTPDSRWVPLEDLDRLPLVPFHRVFLESAGTPEGLP